MSCGLKMQNDSQNPVSSWHNLRQAHYDSLMACAGQTCDNVWLAQMIASWRVGLGVLPDYLGLTSEQFYHVIQSQFPDCHIPAKAVSAINPDFSRMLEKQDLEQYLRNYALPNNPLNEVIITIIVTACLGNDHLWQDLGLWSRHDLSTMLSHFFPVLREKNNKNMKWKKFIYKQLCEEEGIYVCRSPSCEVCKDYQHCFGSED